MLVERFSNRLELCLTVPRFTPGSRLGLKEKFADASDCVLVIVTSAWRLIVSSLKVNMPRKKLVKPIKIMSDKASVVIIVTFDQPKRR